MGYEYASIFIPENYYCFTGTGKREAKNLGLNIQKQLTKDVLQISCFSKASKKQS